MNQKYFFGHCVRYPQGRLTLVHVFWTVNDSNCRRLSFLQEARLSTEQSNGLAVLRRLKEDPVLSWDVGLEFVDPFLGRFVLTLNVNMMNDIVFPFQFNLEDRDGIPDEIVEHNDIKEV